MKGLIKRPFIQITHTLLIHQIVFLKSDTDAAKASFVLSKEQNRTLIFRFPGGQFFSNNFRKFL